MTKEQKKAETLRRVQSMIEGGMEQISSRELEIRLESLGYKLGESFCYENNLNADEFWYAKSFGITEKASGLSFAHIDAPKKNLPALQEIRRECFVFERGKLWEI